MPTPRQIHRGSRRIFFGWWIVLAGAINQGLMSLLYYQSFGAYLVSFRDDFGWTRATLTGAYSFARAESSIVAPIQGWMLDRISPRAVMRVGTVLMAAGFFFLARVDAIWSYYAAYLLIAVGSSLAGFLTVNITVARWFVRKRTRAIAATMIGGTLGGLSAPILAWSLDQFGWRETAVASGVLILLTGLPIAQLLRASPEGYGYLPDGDLRESAPDGTGPRHSREFDGFTLREAARTRAFWLLALGNGTALLSISVINSQLIIHMVDLLEMSRTLATSLVWPAMLVSQLAFQLLGGLLGDRYSKRVVAGVGMIGHGIAMIVLTMSSAVMLIVAAAVIHGASWGIRGPVMTSIRAEYFGRRALGAIMGFGTTFAMIGSTIGPIFAGVVLDVTDSYRPAFAVISAVSVIGSLFFFFAESPPLPLRAHSSETASPGTV